MSKLKYFVLPFICFVMMIECRAQISHIYQPNAFYLSPADRQLNRFRFDIETQYLEVLHTQTALYEMQNKEGDFLYTSATNDSLSEWRNCYIAIKRANGYTNGDYLPDEGNTFSHSLVEARAVRSTQKNGVLHGEASFAKGLHKGYAWNATRHAELYRPYLLLDSTGGDYEYENYYLSGGYAFVQKRTYYGVNASFRGEIATRQTDPRSANTTMWLCLGASLAHKINKRQWFAVNVHYLRNKQHLDLWNWRAMQQDRFFFTYGFGYFDLKESPTFFGVKRMFYMQGAELQFTYSNLKALIMRKPTNFVVDVYYKFLSMKTEEQDAKNLFGSNTHHLNTSLLLGLRQHSRLSFYVVLRSENAFRFGREHIYENYCPDPNYPSIYDFRLVNTRKRYSDVYSKSTWLNKMAYSIPRHKLTIECVAGVALDYTTVKYSKPQQYWEVLSLYPIFGLGAKQQLWQMEWGVNSLCFIKQPQQYTYDVEKETYKIDYQTSFLPYAYYTDQSFNMRNEIYVSYRLPNKHNKLSVALRHYWRKGHRPTDVFYTGEPAIQSSVLSEPKVGKVDNLESFYSLSLFLFF